MSDKIILKDMNDSKYQIRSDDQSMTLSIETKASSVVLDYARVCELRSILAHWIYNGKVKRDDD